MIEAGAGMAVYFFIYAQSGFGLDRLINIRETWDVKAINDLEDDYGQGSYESIRRSYLTWAGSECQKKYQKFQNDSTQVFQTKM